MTKKQETSLACLIGAVGFTLIGVFIVKSTGSLSGAEHMVPMGYLAIFAGIIFFITYLVRKIKSLINEKNLQEAIKNTNISQVDRLNPYEFEEWVARFLRTSGFNAYSTQRSGDYGVDVIAEKNGTKIAIQVKKFSKPVGIKAVQEIIAGKYYYNCHEGWVVTTAPYFTQAAKNLAQTQNIKLFNKNDLAILLNNLQKNNFIDKTSNNN